MKWSEEERPRSQPADSKGPPITKYYRSGEPKSGRSKPPKKASKIIVNVKRWLVRFINIVIVAGVAAGVVYSLIVRPQPQISISSTAYHPESTYRQTASQQLQVLKNRNKVTLDEQGIVSALQKRYPEISSASIELPIVAQTPTVHISIAAPSFFMNSSGKTYIIDSQGRAVAEARSLPKIKGLSVINDASEFSVTRGSQVLSASAVNFINRVISQFQRAKIPLDTITLPTLAQELDVRTTDRPYYVKFFLGGEPLQQIGQFIASRNHFDTSSSKPIEYLDVRVPGKIFYK